MFNTTQLCGGTLLYKGLFKRHSLMNKDTKYLDISFAYVFDSVYFWSIQLVVKPRFRLRPVIISKTLNSLIWYLIPHYFGIRAENPVFLHKTPSSTNFQTSKIIEYIVLWTVTNCYYSNSIIFDYREKKSALFISPTSPSSRSTSFKYLNYYP